MQKNTDFQLLNGLDHQHEAIRSRSWKMLIFDPKFVRIGRNRSKWTAFWTNRIVLMLKTVLKIETFRFVKILRTQIWKMSLKSMKTLGNDVSRSGWYWDSITQSENRLITKISVRNFRILDFLWIFLWNIHFAWPLFWAISHRWEPECHGKHQIRAFRTKYIFFRI